MKLTDLIDQIIDSSDSLEEAQTKLRKLTNRAKRPKWVNSDTELVHVNSFVVKSHWRRRPIRRRSEW